MFIVPPDSALGSEGVVELARSAKNCVAEVELGVVMGKRGKRVSRADALNYVWGYTIVSDLCGLDIIREAQGVGREGLPGAYYLARAKGFDTYQPMGPYITLKDEIPDPQTLTGEMRVNEQIYIRGTTQDMRLSVAQLIEYLFEDITFYPGDTIATGGIGSDEFSGHAALKRGDVVEAEISKIGVLRYYVGEGGKSRR
jgi:2-keto-4-pentenoate hydratase/2-oxohepta-3-ene-1,7-dioic acid hydratase in catechol pathway